MPNLVTFSGETPNSSQRYAFSDPFSSGASLSAVTT